MRKIAVTGGAGFIGSYVCKELARRGYEPVIFDPHGRSVTGIDVIMGDVRDATAVTELAAHVDGIIHLAAVLGTQETIGNPRPAAETNVLGSLNVFEAANQYDLPVVYFGVGNSWMRSHGAGTYVISKTAAEDFTKMFNQHRGGRIATVRPMNAYGPRQLAATPFGPGKVRKIIPAFTLRALCGMPVEVYGDGTQISDCIYVTDVARVAAEALASVEAGVTPSEAIEVGPAESCTVNDVAAMIIELAHELGAPRSELVHLPMRAGEVPNAVVSANTATLDQIGVNPAEFISLADGLTTTVRWYAANEGIVWHRPVLA